MKNMKAILFFTFLSLNGISQRTIKGRIVNGVTGVAIPGSSIFIASTSKGTVSDNAGAFHLEDIPTGTHELIISCIGYETNVFSFSDAQLPLQLKVEMTIKVKELENVMIEPSVEEGWDKWGKSFMDNFVGNTANADHCRIKNEKAIRFRYYKKSNRLIAYCDEPVLLENKALGYTISYQLENFEISFKDHTAAFLGYPLFVPMDGKGRQQKWENKREEAYNGSIFHFMRSLFANRLAEEGFEVRRMVRTPNYEKQRVRSIYNPGLTRQIIKKENGIEINTSIPVTRDSSEYYQAILRQEDFKDVYGRYMLTADSLIIETTPSYKLVHFEEYIFVTYTKEVEEEGYLKTQYPQRNATFQRSYVTLLNEKIISVDKSGNFFNPQEFFTSAYWGWSEKMANSLPLDYEKETKGKPAIR
jgi:CarboxypepD_reg-like domain